MFSNSSLPFLLESRVAVWEEPTKKAHEMILHSESNTTSKHDIKRRLVIPCLVVFRFHQQLLQLCVPR